jgi:hypothetical protein
MKAFDNFAEIEAYLPAIREERSSQKMKDLIEKIIKVLKTGATDPNFVMG